MKLTCLVLCFAAATSVACAASPAHGKTDSNESAGEVRVYKVGDGVTAPQLMPIAFSTAECAKPVSGEVKLSAIVDDSGRPRNVMFIKPLGNTVDKLALNILEADRFKPGERDGVPVPVAQIITLTLDICAITVQHDTGESTAELKPRTQPEQHLSDEDAYPATVIYASDAHVTSLKSRSGFYHVGGDVIAPWMLFGNSKLDVGEHDARAKPKYQGDVIMSVIVDSQGMPQDVQVVRPLGMGLDRKAIDAVNEFRFKPAIRRGKQPVPVMITVQATFRLFQDPPKP